MHQTGGEGAQNHEPHGVPSVFVIGDEVVQVFFHRETDPGGHSKDIEEWDKRSLRHEWCDEYGNRFQEFFQGRPDEDCLELELVRNTGERIEKRGDEMDGQEGDHSPAETGKDGAAVSQEQHQQNQRKKRPDENGPDHVSVFPTLWDGNGRSSRKNSFDQVTVHIGETHVAATEPESAPGVLDT